MPAIDLNQSILTHLWACYRNDAGVSHDITSICKHAGSDAVQVANGLRLAGLIKDEVVVENGKVLCSISMKGIEKVDPAFIEGKITEVLRGMGQVNSISNVFSILKAEPKDFQFAFDLANEMQNRDLVKLLYAFQPGKVVNVEMTLEGVRRRG